MSESHMRRILARLNATILELRCDNYMLLDEVKRLRAAILAHRAEVLRENGLGAGVKPNKADVDLWQALGGSL